MHFEGSGNIYIYNYMYSNACAILKENNLTTDGKGIAVVTFSAFMLESYFNHVCQLIFNVYQRVDHALDSLTNEERAKVRALELPDLQFNDKISEYKGYTKEFNALKKSLQKKVNSKNKSDFDKEFSISTKPGYNCEHIDRKHRFSPRVKCKALLESLFSVTENKPIYKKVDKIFAIRDSLAHGHTQSISGKASLNSILTCDWQEKCSPENSRIVFEQAKEIVKAIDQRIESTIMLGNLQDQFGVIKNEQSKKT